MDNIAGQSLLEPLSDATHRNSAHDPWAVTFYGDGLNRIDPNLCRGDRWHDQSATASRKFFGIWVFLPGPDIVSLYWRRHYGVLGGIAISLDGCRRRSFNTRFLSGVSTYGTKLAI